EEHRGYGTDESTACGTNLLIHIRSILAGSITSVQSGAGLAEVLGLEGGGRRASARVRNAGRRPRGMAVIRRAVSRIFPADAHRTRDAWTISPLDLGRRTRLGRGLCGSTAARLQLLSLSVRADR